MTANAIRSDAFFSWHLFLFAYELFEKQNPNNANHHSQWLQIKNSTKLSQKNYPFIFIGEFSLRRRRKNSNVLNPSIEQDECELVISSAA